MSASSEFKLPADVIRKLTRRSNLKGAVQLAAHLGLLLIAGIALDASFGSPWVLLALPLYGAILVFLFAPLHETIHFTVFETRWINNAVAAVIGFLLFLPYQNFRVFHYEHHRYTQDPQRDPELLDMKPLHQNFWWYLTGLPTWWQSITNIWQHATVGVHESYIGQRHHAAIVKEARIHLAGYAALLSISLLSSSAFLWWFWILPALVGQPLLRLYLLAEHSGCDHGDNMLENSRTTYTVPWLSFLAWNMPYHAEHHYLASVPFHALPALHAYTGQRVKHKGEGYVDVHRVLAAQRRSG